MRWKGINIILFLSQIPDVSYIWVWQVNYAKLLEMGSFFTWHIFLDFGKTQDLPNKIWKTLGDALTYKLFSHQIFKKTFNILFLIIFFHSILGENCSFYIYHHFPKRV